MAAIRGKDTKPEILVRKALHKQGFRYRLHDKNLPGKPDIILPKYKVVIFVHGCFWHGHDCSLFKVPETRTEFWMNKINQNRQRDRKQIAALQESGWRVAIVWECALKGKNKKSANTISDELARWCSSDTNSLTIEN